MTQWAARGVPGQRTAPTAEPTALADRVLEAELQAARVGTGRLPAERELAVRHGLSRTAVRRWLDELERAGTITRHVGRGTFVRALPAAQEDDTSPGEIMAVRLLLEPQLLGLAVASATAADLEEMRTCLRESEAAGSFEEFERWDARLHASIAAATHNSLLIRLFDTMNEARDHPLWGSAKRRSFTEVRRREYEQDHRDLVEAIADRHATEAAAVMRRHLLRIRAALLGTEN